MDYRDRAVVHVHADLEAWHDSTNPERVFAFTVDGEESFQDVAYETGDTFLFGPESVGLPEEVKSMPWLTSRLRIPMVPGVRSLNLATSAAVVVYEAWRQQGFRGSVVP